MRIPLSATSLSASPWKAQPAPSATSAVPSPEPWSITVTRRSSPSTTAGTSPDSVQASGRSELSVSIITDNMPVHS
ncbi:No hit [Brucella canis HSK A52141]|nr:No hit [Brucella canis HSK A52141]